MTESSWCIADSRDAKVGPVVISEVMHYSLVTGVENSDDEFIELENFTTSPMPLYDPGNAPFSVNKLSFSIHCRVIRLWFPDPHSVS